MKKVLFTATVDSHILRFHLPYLEFFKNQGFEVHVATNGKEEIPFCDVRHTVSFERSPFKFNNILATKQLKSIIDNHKFDLIHCHTPMGGVATRVAAMKARKKSTKVIYTAHGFHFYNGAPVLNWLLYYPIEKMLARWTDVLITINEEDYKRAISHRFGAKEILKVNGVGVNVDRFKPVTYPQKIALRKTFGFTESDYLMLCVAEFNSNKNQKLIIESCRTLMERYPSLQMLFLGDGVSFEQMQTLALDYGLVERMHFYGVRVDVDSFLQMSDLLIAASYREGLPINLVESMAVGVPVIASRNRGHCELVADEDLLFSFDAESCVASFERIYIDKKFATEVSRTNLERVKKFTKEPIMQVMSEIYMRIGGMT